jgi:hypothetical protein
MLTMTGKVLSPGLTVLCVYERERAQKEFPNSLTNIPADLPILFSFLFLPNYGNSPVD